MTPKTFADLVVQQLRADCESAQLLYVRARGKGAAVGIDDGDEWVPLFRLTEPSGSCNVMTLEVRNGTRWAPAHVRGVPNVIASELRGPLRFTWEAETQLTWSRTYDPLH